MKYFGTRLKEARTAAKFTQAELAERIGAYQTKYQNWEADINEPDYETVKKLCDTLSVSADWLFGRKATMVQEEQAEYVTTAPADPLTTKLLLIVRSLDAAAQKAVLQYAEEKKIVSKARGTDKDLRDALEELKRSPIGREAEREKKRKKSA